MCIFSFAHYSSIQYTITNTCTSLVVFLLVSELQSHSMQLAYHLMLYTEINYIYMVLYNRVESFIEHQDTCNASRARPELQVTQAAACLSRTASSPSPSSDTNFSASTWPGLRMPKPAAAVYLHPDTTTPSPSNHRQPPHNLELQLMPSSTPRTTPFTSPAISPNSDEAKVTKLQLSVSTGGDEPTSTAVMRIKEETREQLKLAMAEKVMAEEARQQAKRQMELAEEEFTNAKHIRQQAQAELNKAYMLRDQATRQVNAILLQITCQACRQDFRASPATADEGSLAASHMSSVVTQVECADDDDRRHQAKITEANTT